MQLPRIGGDVGALGVWLIGAVARSFVSSKISLILKRYAASLIIGLVVGKYTNLISGAIGSMLREPGHKETRLKHFVLFKSGA